VVAIMSPAGVVHLKTVQLGRDLGASAEITGGLDDHGTVVVAPAYDVVP
jgi:hypothetical protein